MKSAFYVFVLVASFSLSLSSQGIYSTRHGDIALSIGFGDSIILAVSNELQVALNYETSAVSFRAPYSTFRTGVDSIDRRLIALHDTAIEFNGKLGITINTKTFSEQRYNMEGDITGGLIPIPVKGTGSMTCLPAADRISPACTLLLSMETSLWAIQLANVFPKANSGVRVDLRQSILERER